MNTLIMTFHTFFSLFQYILVLADESLECSCFQCREKYRENQSMGFGIHNQTKIQAQKMRKTKSAIDS